MRVVILAIGSRGDVQPYTALGLGLQRAGHDVRLATHVPFRDFVTRRGLDFAPLEGDPRELMQGEAGQTWLQSGRNPIRFVQQFLRVFRPYMGQFFADALAICQDAEAIIYSLFGFAGYHIAEALGIPSYAAMLQPLTRTRAFPLIQLPARFNLGGTFNLMTHILGEQLFWQPMRMLVSRWHQETLNLRPLARWDFYGQLYYKKREPFLYGFSPSVVPKPSDWPDWHHVTGYWFLDRPEDWQPPADLVDFLVAGPPPVYVGFGSMIDKDPEELTELVLKALAQTGQRAVLLTGWGGLSQASLPDEVFRIESIPHDWLFPRMAALGERIRAEDGVTRAVEAFHRHLPSRQ